MFLLFLSDVSPVPCKQLCPGKKKITISIPISKKVISVFKVLYVVSNIR